MLEKKTAEDFDRDAILGAMAMAFWACAWADYQEQAPNGANLSGMEILDLCGNPRPASFEAAESVERRILETTGKGLAEWCARAANLPDCYADRECNEEYFGHYLAMQAMGSGVGLESVCDRKALGLEVPWEEHSWHYYPESVFPEIEEE